ncbi:MAG: ABC transporter permease [Gemmatimonadota bacterium]
MPHDVRRSRPAPLLALGQVRYQLLLLARSPLGFFLTLVIPLLLLVSLKVVAPGGATGGVPYIQWLTPAVSAFCLLNAAYVTTITALVPARDHGILKRLRGTPLPGWSYLAGRFGQVLVTAVVSVAVIIAVGVIFLGVHMVWAGFGYFAAAAALGTLCFFMLGAAVTMVVPKTETALPIAFGTMLPVAFISDVFFSSAHAPHWLSDIASALPVAPVAKAMEASFTPAVKSWPMSTTGLLVVLAWTAGAAVIVGLWFRWDPGPVRLLPWRHRHPLPH